MPLVTAKAALTTAVQSRWGCLKSGAVDAVGDGQGSSTRLSVSVLCDVDGQLTSGTA